jgi:hypothetical protein
MVGVSGATDGAGGGGAFFLRRYMKRWAMARLRSRPGARLKKMRTGRGAAKRRETKRAARLTARRSTEARMQGRQEPSLAMRTAEMRSGVTAARVKERRAKTAAIAAAMESTASARQLRQKNEGIGVLFGGWVSRRGVMFRRMQG